MHISEFLSERVKDCSRFAHYWMLSQEKDPYAFPLHNSPEEWLRHFAVWKEKGSPDPFVREKSS